MSETATATTIPWGSGTLDRAAEDTFRSGLAESGRFLMGQSDVHRALTKLVALLEGEGLPYAIIGGLALAQYGHLRVTTAIDLVLRDEDLERFKLANLGKGYAERVPGTGKLEDTELGIRIDVLSTGRFPGDGAPKPIAFPDPRTTAVRGETFALLPLPLFLELKLASGMTAPHRLKDLADVLELIRITHLPAELADALHPYVQPKFRELWTAAQSPDPYE